MLQILIILSISFDLFRLPLHCGKHVYFMNTSANINYFENITLTAVELHQIDSKLVCLIGKNHVKMNPPATQKQTFFLSMSNAPISYTWRAASFHFLPNENGYIYQGSFSVLESPMDGAFLVGCSPWGHQELMTE